MKVGDRVEIVGRHHPWHGKRGRIVAPFLPGKPYYLDWEVELDPDGDLAYPGQRSGASHADLRLLGEACESCGWPWPTHKAYCPATAAGQGLWGEAVAEENERIAEWFGGWLAERGVK